MPAASGLATWSLDGKLREPFFRNFAALVLESVADLVFDPLFCLFAEFMVAIFQPVKVTAGSGFLAILTQSSLRVDYGGQPPQPHHFIQRKQEGPCYFPGLMHH
jgi:hypothetical protein